MKKTNCPANNSAAEATTERSKAQETGCGPGTARAGLLCPGRQWHEGRRCRVPASAGQSELKLLESEQ
jgi:hypothetical protein